MAIVYDHPLTLQDGKTVLTKPVTLPSGRTIYLRKPKGRDYITAEAMQKNKDARLQFVYALAAQTSYHEGGAPVRYEEVLDWDEDDLAALLTKGEDEEAAADPTQAGNGSSS